jgi:1-acyl-sn-glycerol-3-phosphate acyltransferase
MHYIKTRVSRLISKLLAAFQKTLPLEYFYNLYSRLYVKHMDFIVYPTFKMIWINKIEGKKNFPDGPFIIAANHQSYFDFMGLYGIAKKKIIFFASEKLLKTPILCGWVKHSGSIIIKKQNNSHAMDKGLEVLKKGGILAIFPQGTRSRNGEIEKTYLGAARLALSARVPIVPVGIRNSFEIFPPQEKYPKLNKELEYYIGMPLFFEHYYGKEEDETTCRKVTNMVMMKVAELADKKYKQE